MQYYWQNYSSIFSDRCDVGWIYFRLNCYFIKEEDRNIRWVAAENSCREKGSHLASLRDIYDSEFLFEMLLRIQPVKWARTYIGEALLYLAILHSELSMKVTDKEETMSRKLRQTTKKSKFIVGQIFPVVRYVYFQNKKKLPCVVNIL